MLRSEIFSQPWLSDALVMLLPVLQFFELSLKLAGATGIVQ